MVRNNLRQVDQAVTPAIVPKNIWQWALAYFTLKLSPIDASVMSSRLPIFFCFQPTFNTVEVNELHTTSALADLEQWVDLVELGVPAEPALRDVVILFLDDCWLSLITVILGGSRASRSIWLAFNNFEWAVNFLDNRLVIL
jgi:hypothetical protein